MRRGVPGIFVDSSLDTSITRRHAIAAASSRCLIRAGADEDEDDDFLSPEMRERLKALDAETAPPVDKCPIQHDLGDDDALKCSKDWVNAIVSDAGICPFSLSAAVHKSHCRASPDSLIDLRTGRRIEQACRSGMSDMM